MNRTANDVPVPSLRRPEIIDQRVLGECGKSTIWVSQMRDWLQRNPGYTGLDYLAAVTKPARDAGTLPTFNNWQDFAAWILAQPPPPEPEPSFEDTVREYLG